jgi:hypothetical protein
MQNLSETIDNLPPGIQQKVFDYIDELTKNRKKKRKKLNLNWEGGLKEYKDQFTSLELQKKSLEWWTD